MKKRLTILVTLVLLISFVSVEGQQFIPLWPKDNMPDSKGIQITDSIARERAFRVAVPCMLFFLLLMIIV